MRNECEMVISIRNGNENGGIAIRIAIAMENANGKWLGMSCVWGMKMEMKMCAGPARSDFVDSASKSALSRDQIKVNSSFAEVAPV